MELWLTSIDPYTELPSFFELFMCSSITRSLRQTSRTYCQRFISSVTSYAPSLSALNGFGDEVHLALVTMIESRSLLSPSCATLSETLYGCKRCRVFARDRGELSYLPLNSRERLLAAFLAALHPYLKDKADAYYERCMAEVPGPNEVASGEAVQRQSQNGGGGARGRPRTRSSPTAKSTFKFLYPFLHSTHEGLFFAYQWAYLFNFTVYFSPILHLLNQAVRRLTLADLHQRHSTKPRVSTDGAAFNRKRDKAVRMLRVAAYVAVASFFLVGWATNARNVYRQRLQAATGDSESGGDSENASLQPPQSVAESLPEHVKDRLSQTKHLCPLCQRTRVNPAVAPTGFVFCYRCIINHIRDMGTCPITNIEINEDQIFRLFET